MRGSEKHKLHTLSYQGPISAPPYPYGTESQVSEMPREISPLLARSEEKGDPDACPMVHSSSSCMTMVNT